MKTLKLIETPTMKVGLILAFALGTIYFSGCTKTHKESDDVLLSGTTYDKKNQSASVSAITVNVQTVGAVGNGTTDDTWAFNAAITQVNAAGGGTVYVPAGTYLIDADTSIKMKSNVILDMVDTTTRKLLVKATSSKRYNVIRMHNISNAQVKYGKILGERYIHIISNPSVPGTFGEHGMGISIYGATNCKVIRTVILNCWGDGITIGSQSIYNAPNASINCQINYVRSHSNRRQGLSVGNVDSLIVSWSKFTRTYGTPPQAGIDIEPDWYQTGQRIYLLNNEISHNAGDGVEINEIQGKGITIQNITAEGNDIHHNAYSFYVQNSSNLKLYHNTLQNNDWNGPANGGNGNTPVMINCTNFVTTPNNY